MLQIAEQKKFNPFSNAIKPLKELAAFEAIWAGTVSFKAVANIFKSYPGYKLSEIASLLALENEEGRLLKILTEAPDPKLRFLLKGTMDYPQRLEDAEDPIPVLYYQGNADYLNTRSVAIVGTRKPSEDGKRRTEQLVRELVKLDFTIVSGLAQGIDTVAHTTALKLEGRTIAVVGTPLNEAYPKENKALQSHIAHDHLLVSSIPFLRYSSQNYQLNRFFFPERNKTMSALTEATIIVEAGETSGTLIQAKAALFQKRKLFILDSCFRNAAITWPEKFERQGAIRVKSFDDIAKALY